MRYAQIRKMDISNGEGIGVALFVQGCHFHCKNCFNQETWDFNGGQEWTDDAMEDFLKLADKPYIKRISILGGEPLCLANRTGIFNLIVNIRKRYGNSKQVWLYTGYTWENIQCKTLTRGTYVELLGRDMRVQGIVSGCDVIIDGQYVDELRDYTLKWRGSSNQRIIDVQRSLWSDEMVLWDK